MFPLNKEVTGLIPSRIHEHKCEYEFERRDEQIFNNQIFVDTVNAKMSRIRSSKDVRSEQNFKISIKLIENKILQKQNKVLRVEFVTRHTRNDKNLKKHIQVPCIPGSTRSAR